VKVSVTTGGVTCQSADATTQTSNVQALPSVSSSTSSLRCGNGTVTLLAVASPNAVIDWYSAPSDGTLLATGSNAYTTSLTATATYYAQARNTTTGCVSASRTAVTATVTAMLATPAITASASTVCVDAALTFWASTVTGGTYLWTASAGTANGSSYTFDTSTAGAVTATVNVTAGENCMSEASPAKAAIVALLPATPEITLVSADTVSQNTNVAFRVTAPVDGATYTWDGAGTASGAGNGTFTVSGAATGTKSVTVYATAPSSGVNCQSAISDAATATVMALPVTNLSAPEIMRVSAATVCQNEDVVFRVDEPAGNATYTWGGTAGTASGAGNGTFTVSGATTGTKSVTVYATVPGIDDVPATSLASPAVAGFVAALPATPMVTWASAATVVCQNTNVAFRVNEPAGNATYTWMGGIAGTVSGPGNCSYTVSGATTGTKAAMAFAQVAYGDVTCQSRTSNRMAIEVMALPATPVVTRVSAATVCQNTNVVFRVTTPVDGAAYTWNGAGTASGPGNCSYTVSGAATGTKSVTVVARVAYGGVTCQSGTSGAVDGFVTALPDTPAITRVSAATVCQNSNVVFRVNERVSGTTYTWSGAAGTASGAGNGTFTVSGATTGTKSVTAFAEVAYTDVTCRSGTSGAATVTVIALLATPTVTSSSRCGRGTVTLLASTPSPGAVIFWYSASSGGTLWEMGNTYTTPSLWVSATYYAEARNTTTGCVSASRTAVTATVNAVPSVTLSSASGSNNQTVYSGTTITPIVYTASNATSISQGGSLPAGVSSSVTNNTVLNIYGMPSAAGTFGYTVTASNSNGCSDATATGTITVNLPPAPASAQTWVYGGLTWSDRIAGPPACDKSDFLISTTEPQCRSYTSGTTTWYYYNWAYVNTNKSTMCPSPWHVPTKADFETLANATTNITLINTWGYSGYANDSSVNGVGTYGYYWSSTEDGNLAYNLLYYSGHLVAGGYYKNGGMQVRCVK
jgi:hypothetical protein